MDLKVLGQFVPPAFLSPALPREMLQYAMQQYEILFYWSQLTNCKIVRKFQEILLNSEQSQENSVGGVVAKGSRRP